jgi:hypothetical protein
MKTCGSGDVVVIIYTTCFNIVKLCILPAECIFVFRMVLTVDSDFTELYSYHRSNVCFLWGTNWIFKSYLEEIGIELQGAWRQDEFYFNMDPYYYNLFYFW